MHHLRAVWWSVSRATRQTVRVAVEPNIGLLLKWRFQIRRQDRTVVIAGQRAMPVWARGRMNAVHMMVSQGGVALGGILWGGSTIYLGLGETLVCGALVASLALAIPLSINFAHSLKLDPAPLEGLHDFPSAPKPDDGPVTVTMEFTIRAETGKNS